MQLTRIYHFSASHRLHSEQMTAEENSRLYGKCNNPHGHGHDYTLHVTVRGTPDETTGRVVNPGALDRFVQEKILDVFDHADMNADIPEFQGVPTTENLALETERRLKTAWPFSPVELDRIRIQETPRNRFELRTR